MIQDEDMAMARDNIYQFFVNNKTLIHLDISNNKLTPVIMNLLTTSLLSRYQPILLHTDQCDTPMFDFI